MDWSVTDRMSRELISLNGICQTSVTDLPQIRPFFVERRWDDSSLIATASVFENAAPVRGAGKSVIPSDIRLPDKEAASML